MKQSQQAQQMQQTQQAQQTQQMQQTQTAGTFDQLVTVLGEDRSTFYDLMADCHSSDQVISELILMGFELSSAEQAVKKVGPSVSEAVEYILSGSLINNDQTSSHGTCSTSSKKCQKEEGTLLSSHQIRQSRMRDHFQSKCSQNTIAKSASKMRNVCETKQDWENIAPDWEQSANCLLQKHFGYQSFKEFQMEALATWIDQKDCLVLAATGSGKSLCYQIPALISGKVVIVISPLISLMHDQCLKLSKCRVTACFLGSGQPDSHVEHKAMSGMYNVIYVCPETVLRLIKPLQKLAEGRGIALFAIDEAHCVSKWGHDFRPDYRRLCVLRENFSAESLKFLKFDVPLMALTATATVEVRGDIIESLSMSQRTKIVLTSFFRPNLQFSVKHSRTTSPSSYKSDFSELIDTYGRKRTKRTNNSFSKESSVWSDYDGATAVTSDDSSSNDDVDPGDNQSKKMSVDYLENDADVFHSVDDWDVACGEFCGQPCNEDKDAYVCGPCESLQEGITIIYVPTRKETLRITSFLCGYGVNAAAYNASLPKSHLRQVHKEFHENMLEVVVATIAFGMGIDKLNIRRIIHYGWPQSLEAYYQEAGRAGRDGKLAECILYVNQSRIPSLLPSKRSEVQTKRAYRMLSDCFRYGMNTSCCRAKILVEYFGEVFSTEKCKKCDMCVDGPPGMQNLKDDIYVLMQVIAEYHAWSSSLGGSLGDSHNHVKSRMPNLKMFVNKIREHSPRYLSKDHLWWRGVARILETKGYVVEGDHKVHVQITFPIPTKVGLAFLQAGRDEQAVYCYPEADMLLSLQKPESHPTFSSWGRGWADPEIRRQRLGKHKNTRSRKSRRKKAKISLKSKSKSSSRDRISAKLFHNKANSINSWRG